MFISIHVPKTAGTTLGYLLDHGTDRRILYLYRKDYTNLGGEDADYWREHAGFVEHQFDVIHGHFYYEKFCDIFPAARYITCLRHPVKRMVSQWLHAVQEGNNYIAEAARRGMTIVDWVASDPRLTQVFKTHLGSRELKDYEFVFLSENFEQCWRLFEATFSFRRNDPNIGHSFPRLNDGRLRGTAPTVPESHLQAVYNLCAEDVEIYRRGVELVHARLNKFQNTAAIES